VPRRPCRDYPNSPIAPSVDDCNEPAVDPPGRDDPPFVPGPRIDELAHPPAEYADGKGEIKAMLVAIFAILGVVPLEFHRQAS
jgi:hypothetical protein